MSVVWIAAVAAIVELDAAALGQFMVSRPIVLGPALGAGLGDASLGAGVGILCELFSLGQAPVGGRLALNATVAVSAALLWALGPARLPIEAALPAGLAVGFVHARFEASLRGRRSAVAARVCEAIARGRDPKLGRLAAAELALQAAATFALLAVALAAGGPLAAGFAAAPGFAQAGFRVGLGFSPLLALASLIHSFRVVS